MPVLYFDDIRNFLELCLDLDTLIEHSVQLLQQSQLSEISPQVLGDAHGKSDRALVMCTQAS